MSNQKKESGGGVKGLLGNKDAYQLTVVFVDGAPFHGPNVSMQQQREQEKMNVQIRKDLETAVEE